MNRRPNQDKRSATPDAAAVERLARAVAGLTPGHARALTAFLPAADAELRQTVEREVLAFAACLVEMKLREQEIPLPRPFAEFLADAARDRHASFAANVERQLHRLLTARTDASDWPRELVKAGDGPFRLDAETYEEFCRTTGFDSKLVVGNGANLAALMFYLVTFGLVGCNPAMTREARKLLLKEARRCRVEIEACVKKFLKTLPNDLPPLLGGVGRDERVRRAHLPRRSGIRPDSGS